MSTLYPFREVIVDIKGRDGVQWEPHSRARAMRWVPELKNELGQTLGPASSAVIDDSYDRLLFLP